MPRTANLQRVLVIDDEADLLLLMQLTLTKLGLEVITAASWAEAQEKLLRERFALCLTDMRLGDGSGLDVLRLIQERGLDLPCAVITAYGNTDNAVTALKAGAFDYLAKPVSLEQLRTLVKSALQVQDRARVSNSKQVTAARQARKSEAALIGQSQAISSLRETIQRYAASSSAVHIHGESGTGKELAARMLHAASPRADGPFVAVNCGAIPENLMESEFFGYRKGAFTGAEGDREGYFQAASGGTLFLDEVADLPLTLQVKLLRAIQEKKVRRVGGTQEEPCDVRIVSATHKSLTQEVSEGRFRQDLFYRLHVLQIEMPPLRHLDSDIELIAMSILERITGREDVRLTPRAIEALHAYDFPGNVRELENVLERAVALASDPAVIDAEDLRLRPEDNPVTSAAARETMLDPGSLSGRTPLQDFLDRCERETIEMALAQTRNNRTQAAKLLGITFRSLRYRLSRLGMRQDDE